MGERKGVNKYYPPDYDPSKGGLNRWQGTHALRERARKLHLGILIIRFEMPYNIWCEGCDNHIGTGVRYNAEKKKVGMYYTTPVYEFRMKCHLCDNHFVIKTDPANLDYEIVSGARRQERRWDPSENEQVAPEDKAVSRKMAADAMFKLEKGSDDLDKAKALEPVIKDLEDFQASRWEDDFSANQLLRQRFRASENTIKAQERIDAAHNISVSLLPPSEGDARQAALLAISSKSDTIDPGSKDAQKIVDAQSVFARLKSKTLSKTEKKELAKQSVESLVAATTSNFNTFQSCSVFDKSQLAVLKGIAAKRRKRKCDEEHVSTKDCHYTEKSMKGDDATNNSCHLPVNEAYESEVVRTATNDTSSHSRIYDFSNIPMAISEEALPISSIRNEELSVNNSTDQNKQSNTDNRSSLSLLVDYSGSESE